MITGAGTENSDEPYCGAGIGGGTNADGMYITINGGCHKSLSAFIGKAERVRSALIKETL